MLCQVYRVRPRQMALDVLIEEDCHEFVRNLGCKLSIIYRSELVLGLEWVIGIEFLSYLVLIV